MRNGGGTGRKVLKYCRLMHPMTKNCASVGHFADDALRFRGENACFQGFVGVRAKSSRVKIAVCSMISNGCVKIESPFQSKVLQILDISMDFRFFCLGS